MSDLTTNYMGLKLLTPWMVASCSLSKTEDGIRRCAQAGAGAIVLKSLFEEQIEAGANKVHEYLWMPSHTEAFDYIGNMSMEIGAQEYLKLIEKAKKSCEHPYHCKFKLHFSKMVAWICQANRISRRRWLRAEYCNFAW